MASSARKVGFFALFIMIACVALLIVALASPHWINEQNVLEIGLFETCVQLSSFLPRTCTSGPFKRDEEHTNMFRASSAFAVITTAFAFIALVADIGFHCTRGKRAGLAKVTFFGLILSFPAGIATIALFAAAIADVSTSFGYCFIIFIIATVFNVLTACLVSWSHKKQSAFSGPLLG